MKAVFFDGESIKLKEVSKLGKREETISYMQDFIKSLHLLLIEKPDKSKAAVVKTAQKTLLSLKANGNINLQMTNFVINI